MKQFKLILLEEDCPHNIAKSIQYYLHKLKNWETIYYREGKNFIGKIIDVSVNYVTYDKVQLFGTIELLKNELEFDL